MSHPQYGRTWWGAQWLQALTQIDHDNRLPRGRTYANRGAVRDLVGVAAAAWQAVVVVDLCQGLQPLRTWWGAQIGRAHV